MPICALKNAALQKRKLYNFLSKNQIEIFQNVILNTKDCTKMKIYKNKIFLSSDDGTMTIFDLQLNKLRIMPVHDYGIWAFDCTKNYTVTGSIDRRVAILDKNLFIKPSTCLYFFLCNLYLNILINRPGRYGSGGTSPQFQQNLKI